MHSINSRVCCCAVVNHTGFDAGATWRGKRVEASRLFASLLLCEEHARSYRGASITNREQNYMDRNTTLQKMNAKAALPFTLIRLLLRHEQSGTRYRMSSHGRSERTRSCACVQFAALDPRVRKPKMRHWTQRSWAVCHVHCPWEYQAA